MQYKCNWRKRAEKKAIKRLKLKKQQDYALNKISKLFKKEKLKVTCRFHNNYSNSNSSSSSNDNFSIDCEMSDQKKIFSETENNVSNFIE